MIDLIAWGIVAIAFLLIVGMVSFFLLVVSYRAKLNDWNTASFVAWHRTKKALREIAEWIPWP